jgi:hypothetical protein
LASFSVQTPRFGWPQPEIVVTLVVNNCLRQQPSAPDENTDCSAQRSAQVREQHLSRFRFNEASSNSGLPRAAGPRALPNTDRASDMPVVRGRPYLTDEIIATQQRVVARSLLFIAHQSDHPGLVRDPEPGMVDALRSFRALAPRSRRHRCDYGTGNWPCRSGPMISAGFPDCQPEVECECCRPRPAVLRRRWTPNSVTTAARCPRGKTSLSRYAPCRLDTDSHCPPDRSQPAASKSQPPLSGLR